MEQLALRGHYKNGVVHLDAPAMGIPEGAEVTVHFDMSDQFVVEFPSGMSREELRQRWLNRIGKGYPIDGPLKREELYDRP